MEVKIGVQNAVRELVIDSALDGPELQRMIEEALRGDGGLLLALTDTKGRRVLVPVDKLAFVEIGSPSVGQVGFRS